MADTDTSGVSAVLAPWMAQNPWDMSQYGGQGQFGADMLAAAGPTPYRMPFGVALGKGMLAGQASALENAKSRMGLAMNSLAFERQMSMWPMLQRILARMSGGAPMAGAPGGTPAPSGVTGLPAAPNASAAALASAAPQSGAPTGAAPAASPVPAVRAPWMSDQSSDDLDPLDESRAGAVLSAMGVTNEFGKDAALRLQYNPGAATTMEAAKSAPAVDLLMYARALEANGGRPNEAAQAFLNKFKTDTGMQHIGSMSGIFTQVEPDGSVTTFNPTTGLRVNSRTGATYMPGALKAFGDRESVEAGARTRAELGAETGAGDGGGGGGAGGGATAPAPGRAAPAGAAPAEQLSGMAAIQSPNFVPQVLSQAGAVPQRRGSTSLVALKALQEGAAADANKTVEEMQERASEGQTLLAQTAQIRSSASEYPWTGRFADDRGAFLNILQGAGWLSPEKTKELSAYQDASKISIQLQASATRQLGSREAAQVFSVMGKSIPNLTLSPDGLDKVSAYMEGIARYNQAMSAYGQRLRSQGNAAAVNELENSFIAHTNPTYFILASASDKTRGEFLASIPAAKRAQFIEGWNTAWSQGLAPKPSELVTPGQQ